MSSEVYQVDLIAALFGGFMVIWLSTASESEQPSSERHQHYAVLEMAVDQGAGPISVLPWSLHGRSCVPSSVIEELKQSLSKKIFGCERVNRPANIIFQRFLTGNRFDARFRYAFSEGSVVNLANQLVTSFSRSLEITTTQLQLSPLGYLYQEVAGRGGAFQLTPNVAEVEFFLCAPGFAACPDQRVVQLRQTASPMAVWGVQKPVLGRLKSITLMIRDIDSAPSQPAHPFVYDRIFRGGGSGQRMVAAGAGPSNEIVVGIRDGTALGPNQMLRLTASSTPIAADQPIQARLCVVGPAGQECFATRPGTTVTGSIELDRI
jgi:hypothetical protein